MDNVSFKGSYSKIVKNPSKLFNRETISKNNYLPRDFSRADLPLMELAKKLGDEDTVTLMSKENDLKLLVKSAGKDYDIDLGIEEGLYERVYNAFELMMTTLKLW